ncbi:MAG: flippase-like domain-containing protein [Deltaproteobacteria bacterium]|nr:flippase-like domain-containing protein [Deltaproteobacteria bacterium]
MKHINKPAQLLDWKLWTGLLISALFIYLALRKVDLPLMWEVIKSSDLSFLSLVIITVFFQFVIRAWRWGILLEPVKKTGFLNRLHSTLIGFAANCILPARLGEFVKANYIGHTESISSSSSFGTIVVERLFDCFTLLLVLFIGLIGTTFPAELGSISGSLRVTGFFLFLFYILLIILLVGFKYKAKSFMKLIGRVLFFLPHYLRSRIIDIIWNFSLGLVIIKNPYKWFQAVFYSFLIWFLSLYQVVLIEQSIGLTLPFIATFIVLAMASFGVMIPSAPGFIGTFHLSVQYGFLFYGIGKEEALSAAILWHAAFFFPTIFFGLISFLILQTSFDKLSGDPDILKRGN